MLNFNEKDLATIKERAKRYPEIFREIDESTKEARENPIVPDKAYATWGHYYVCPKHGVKFIHNRNDSKNYVCPIDGEVYTGQPYEGGWWSGINYQNAADCSALATSYICTGNTEHLSAVKYLLLGYAKSFRNYEVHGDIPYNKPGRMNSQVLDDSAQMYEYAAAYSLVKDCFTEEERIFVENEFFVPATRHIIENITHQIHNHEVNICCAIGAVGLALGRRDFCEFAVNEKYGLKYQLDNALLKSSFWFEGSVGYHFYSLKALFRFDRLARYTEYSLTAHPRYSEILKKMLLLPFSIVDSDGILPKLNDGGGGTRISDTYSDIYEYAYAVFKDERLLPPIYEAIANRGGVRFTNYLTLCYGVEELPQRHEQEIPRDYLDGDGSGLAIIRGKDKKCLLFKAMPYGGEHDHYDRLALSFKAFGKNICADMGTSVGYGSPMHYAYYKNTATHNTVCINGENIAPCETRVIKYEKREDGSYILDAKTLPPDDFVMPDSFTIQAWPDDTYSGCEMRRTVIYKDEYFIDIFKVSAKNELRKDWIWHTAGEITLPQGSLAKSAVADGGPQALLTDVYSYTAEGITKLTYDCKDGVSLDIHALSDGKELIFAKGDNNPATSKISYVMERCFEKECVYINVFEAYKDGNNVIDKVDAANENGSVTVTVHERNGESFTYSANI